MKKISLSITIAALLMYGCSDKPQEETKTEAKTSTEVAKQAEVAPALYGASTTAPAHAAPQNTQNMPTEEQHIATVLDTMNAAGYTYAQVNEDGNVYWIAGPTTTISEGMQISFIEQMVMENFTSKALNKTFDYLVFASAIINPNDSAKSTTASHSAKKDHDCDTCSTDKAAPIQQATAQQPSHTPYGAHGAPTKQEPKELKKTDVAKAKGGYSVEELYAKKDTLKDKQVKVNAQVVKVSKNIMGKDWIHIQDGSGVAGTNDIIATSINSTVNVGDIVSINGKVSTNVDLGYGYNFSVMIEEAKFSAIN